MLFSWLRKLRRRPALAGAPQVRRVKTYSAESGYVYEYVYEGWRAARDRAEFVFSVSADRKTYRPVAVSLEAAAVAAWEGAHGRELSANERHALATIALRQALDERTSPALAFAAVRVRAADIGALAGLLDLE